MSDKFMHGSPVLLGDNTVPGVKIPDNLKKLLPRIFQSVTDFGCDYYPTVVYMLTYDEISEVAAYGGFPVRYPHWKFGMEYEELQRGYEHGMHRIYEMVINTNPCYIYCLDSNTLVDNVTVVAHALFHNDFFKNNIFFSHTDGNMMNELANHGRRIRTYMSRWGKEKVTAFIDHVLRLETLIDHSKANQDRVVKDAIVSDNRKVTQPPRLSVKPGHDYMEPYINTPDWKAAQKEKAERQDAARELGIHKETKDILGFLKDHAPLKPWQQDIVSMIYQESIYFAPQGMTKMLNEGWASFGDYNMMALQGMCGLGQDGHDFGIIEYAKHKTGVLGGKFSMNPYKLGFYLFLDIEERWNKGKFGPEWENETDVRKRENWDKKLGLGHEKVFEVRRNYNDYTAINEFFTQEFCDKYEFYLWKHYPNGEYKIETRDYKVIKKKLMAKYLNRGLPEIRLADSNYRGQGYMLLQHYPDEPGKTLYQNYVIPTLQSLYTLWNRGVYLATYDDEGREIVYMCDGTGDSDVSVVNREKFEQEV